MTDAPERIAIKWVEGAAITSGPLMQHSDYTHYVRADRIEALEAERNEALNQLDSALYSVSVLEKRAKTFCDGWGIADKGRIEAEAKLNDQTHLIEQLFALLEIKEQKDDGRYFHPNIIRSSRALDAEKLEKILGKLRGYINE